MPEVWYYQEIRDRDKKIRELGKENERLQKELADERRKREQAEQELKHIAERKASKKPHFSDYSVGTQEKKMGTTLRKKSPGRRKTVEKIAEATIVRNVYPTNTPFRQCRYLRSHTVTHLMDGKAVRVLYRIYGARDGGKQGELSGVLPQGEYGIDVAVALALLVYGVEISIDQACKVLAMFCGLTLSKSRADSLLNQLSALWGKDFEAIKDAIRIRTKENVYLTIPNAELSKRKLEPIAVPAFEEWRKSQEAGAGTAGAAVRDPKIAAQWARILGDPVTLRWR